MKMEDTFFSNASLSSRYGDPLSWKAQEWHLIEYTSPHAVFDHLRGMDSRKKGYNSDPELAAFGYRGGVVCFVMDAGSRLYLGSGRQRDRCAGLVRE